jgi:hypothetical protein
MVLLVPRGEFLVLNRHAEHWCSTVCDGTG